jgi:VWFA-related protein
MHTWASILVHPLEILLPLFRIRLFLLFLLSLCAAVLQGQIAAPEGAQAASLVKAGVQAVAVDVVVTRGGNEPVTALGQKDFEVLEDGKAQAIGFFEEHTAAPGAPAAAAPALPPHVFSNQPAAPASDSVNVLLLDSLNTPEAEQANVHKQTIEFIQKIQPGTPVAIFTLNTKLRLLAGFTTDIGQLKAALGRKDAATGTSTVSRTRDDDLRDREEVAILQAMVGNADAGLQAASQSAQRSLGGFANDQGSQRTLLTLTALEQLARSLAAVPGRKNLIWFASSFPMAVFPAVKEQRTGKAGQELVGKVHETANLLTASKVAVYPVDAEGIHVDHSADADSGGSSQGDDMGAAAAQDLATRTANMAAMEQLATDTGGEAFYSSNNLSQTVAQAMENGAHYYTLVYTPPSRQLDGKFHRIEVKLREGKAKLAYRRGYYADDARAPQPNAPADPLAPLLGRGMTASTQIVYQVRVMASDQQPGQDAARAGANAKLSGPLTRYKVDFAIPAAAVALDPQRDGTRSGKIEVALVAYDGDGKPLNWSGQTLGLSLNAASWAQVRQGGIPAHLQIDLPANSAWLATGVYDLTAAKAGTMEIRLEP